MGQGKRCESSSPSKSASQSSDAMRMNACRVRFVFCIDRPPGDTIPAKIINLMSTDGKGLAVVERFYLHLDEHEIFDLPLIFTKGELCIIGVDALLFDFNVQPSPEGQSLMINLFPFHNIHLLFDILPPSFTSPKLRRSIQRRPPASPSSTGSKVTLLSKFARRITISLSPQDSYTVTR